MAHSQRFEHFLGLLANRIAIIRFHARGQLDRDSATFARLDPHVQVRANLRTRVPGFARCHPFDDLAHEFNSCVSKTSTAFSASLREALGRLAFTWPPAVRLRQPVLDLIPADAELHRSLQSC